MEIDVTCPQCKNEAISKIRKVTAPGVFLTCKSCQAEIGIKEMYSPVNIFSVVVALPLIKLFPDSAVYWVGWFVLFVGCTFHLAKVPLKIINEGPNHAKYNS